MNHYACALLLRDGRLLLGRRAPHRKSYANRWDVIGGRVEEGENLAEALARELGEEIGITPTQWSPLRQIADSGPEARGDATYHMFAVTAWTGGEPRLANHEHTELAWFTVEDACALPDLALPAYRDLFRALPNGSGQP